MSNHLAFLACVESGKLEDQTILLCRSIRRFAGTYRDVAIYAFQPRPGMDVSARTRTVLGELGVVLIDKPLNVDFNDYGMGNKIFVCAYAERVLDESILVFVDSDTVMIGEPTDLDLSPGIDVALRPADSTLLNSRGPGDAIDSYWQRVFLDCALGDVPFVETELGRRVRAFFSAGLIAVRREVGVFREWEQDFRRLIGRGIVPEGAIKRMDEVALIAPVVRRFARTRLLDIRYNYLIYRRPIMVPPLRGLSIDQMIHIHYRFAFYKRDFLKTVQPPLDQNSKTFRWLVDKLPLEPTIVEAEDTTQVPTCRGGQEP